MIDLTQKALEEAIASLSKRPKPPNILAPTRIIVPEAQAAILRERGYKTQEQVEELLQDLLDEKMGKKDEI